MPKIDRDGIGLHYEEAGRGSPAIVLLHCWGGDHRSMLRQLEHFSPRHRVVALDFRGFGASDKPAQAYTMEVLADDVEWLCGQLELDRPVLVGHSMGGTVALAVAARYPERARAIAIVEAMVVAPPAMVEAVRPVLQAVRSDAYAGAVQQFIAQLCGPHFDADEKKRIVAEAASNRQDVMASSLEHVLAYDSAEAAAACKVPILYMSSGTWYTDVDRFRQLCPQLVTSQAIGCGHYFQLEVPDQVNAMLERFVWLHCR